MLTFNKLNISICLLHIMEHLSIKSIFIVKNNFLLQMKYGNTNLISKLETFLKNSSILNTYYFCSEPETEQREQKCRNSRRVVHEET